MILWLLLVFLHDPLLTLQIKYECPERPVCEKCWSWQRPFIPQTLEVTAWPVPEPMPYADLRAFAQFQNAFDCLQGDVPTWRFETRPIRGWYDGIDTVRVMVVFLHANYVTGPWQWVDMNKDGSVDLLDWAELVTMLEDPVPIVEPPDEPEPRE